jgi:hypothetical protein
MTPLIFPKISLAAPQTRSSAKASRLNQCGCVRLERSFVARQMKMTRPDRWSDIAAAIERLRGTRNLTYATR